MARLSVVLLLVVATALVLRWRRPAWYWMTFGVTLAALRVSVRYASVMDACGLTVPPSRWRLALSRMTNRPAPEPRAPRILRLRPTRTGLVLRLKLRPGQDAFDVSAATDRLRHSFGMYGVTAREIRSGVVELRMTGYDVLKRVQMPAKARPRSDAHTRRTARGRIGPLPRLPGRPARAHARRHRVGQVRLPAQSGGRSRRSGRRARRHRLQARCRAVPARSPLLRPRRQPGHRSRTARSPGLAHGVRLPTRPRTTAHQRERP